MGIDDGDDRYRGFVPPEDRVWRHPAEVGALMAAAQAAPAVARRPWGVAMFSALGGALAVAAVFVSIGQLDPDLIVVREQVAVQSVTTEPRVVEPAEWAREVGGPVQAALTSVEVVTDGARRHGTGIVLRDDGHVVVPAPLVRGAESISMTLDDGSRVDARLVGADDVSALAVVRADTALPDPAVQAPEMALSAGDHVAVVGTDDDAVSPDQVVRVRATVVDRRAQAHHDLAVLDGTLRPSQVGGAVVADTGAVVGMATRVAGSAYEALVVPIEMVRSVSSQLIDDGAVRHGPWLGIDVEARADARPGVAVSAVIFDGPGFLAGVRAGDVITEIDGEPVSSPDALVNRLRTLDPDHDVALTVLRRDEQMTPTVTLGRRPLVD